MIEMVEREGMRGRRRRPSDARAFGGPVDLGFSSDGGGA